MADVVQRWRVVYRRGPGARELAQRAESEAWVAAVTASALPVAGAPGRIQLGMATPLPVGLEAEAERLDLSLVRRMGRAEVRAALEPVVPPDHELVDVHDVWTGEPPLVGRVVAADYRLEVVLGPAGDADEGSEGSAVSDGAPGDRAPARAPAVELAGAAERLLAAASLPRVRRRGDRGIPYDLRPFLLELSVGEAAPPGEGRVAVVRCRLRVDPTAGTGRPDEVLSALGEALGRALELVRGTRERLWLADETDEPAWGTFTAGGSPR